MPRKVKTYTRKFVSENRIANYRNEKRRLKPNYVGRSSLDRWVMENGKNLEYIENGWRGEITIKGYKYNIEANYVNHRPFKVGQDLNKVMRSGNTILFDEEITIMWKWRKDMPDSLLRLFIGENRLGFFQFQEIEI
ncbi:hypothetical protein J4466_03990 [Candidatus Pacearchaeota archaeon]|nr:hypothetical protein [Candidatus Pacearchaeota archaeon]